MARDPFVVWPESRPRRWRFRWHAGGRYARKHGRTLNADAAGTHRARSGSSVAGAQENPGRTHRTSVVRDRGWHELGRARRASARTDLTRAGRAVRLTVRSRPRRRLCGHRRRVRGWSEVSRRLAGRVRCGRFAGAFPVALTDRCHSQQGWPSRDRLRGTPTSGPGARTLVRFHTSRKGGFSAARKGYCTSMRFGCACARFGMTTSSTPWLPVA